MVQKSTTSTPEKVKRPTLVSYQNLIELFQYLSQSEDSMNCQLFYDILSNGSPAVYLSAVYLNISSTKFVKTKAELQTEQTILCTLKKKYQNHQYETSRLNLVKFETLSSITQSRLRSQINQCRSILYCRKSSLGKLQRDHINNFIAKRDSIICYIKDTRNDKNYGSDNIDLIFKQEQSFTINGGVMICYSKRHSQSEIIQASPIDAQTIINSGLNNQGQSSQQDLIQSKTEDQRRDIDLVDLLNQDDPVQKLAEKKLLFEETQEVLDKRKVQAQESFQQLQVVEIAQALLDPRQHIIEPQWPESVSQYSQIDYRNASSIQLDILRTHQEDTLRLLSHYQNQNHTLQQKLFAQIQVYGQRSRAVENKLKQRIIEELLNDKGIKVSRELHKSLGSYVHCCSKIQSSNQVEQNIVTNYLAIKIGVFGSSKDYVIEEWNFTYNCLLAIDDQPPAVIPLELIKLKDVSCMLMPRYTWSLEKYVRQKQGFTQESATTLARLLLSTFTVVNLKGLYHCRLNPTKILFNNFENFIISGWRFDNFSECSVQREYLPPELFPYVNDSEPKEKFKMQPLSFKGAAQAFSVGAVLFYCLFKRAPYTLIDLCRFNLGDLTVDLPKDIQNSKSKLFEVVKGLIALDRNKRPTLKQALDQLDNFE